MSVWAYDCDQDGPKWQAIYSWFVDQRDQSDHIQCPLCNKE